MKKEAEFNFSQVSDYTERMWFVGTDLVEESDLLLMSQGVGSSFVREEGAIYYVRSRNDLLVNFKKYSQRFQGLLLEANKRGYVWVFFDRDIESK